MRRSAEEACPRSSSMPSRASTPSPGCPTAPRSSPRCARAADAADGVAVLFLDLDDFKVVNDGFGHEAGDRLLIQVAQRLRGAVRDGDLVARLGGDEFTVLCAGAADQARPTITAGRIRAALSEPFDVAGQRRHVRVSIGCRVAAPGEADADALLRDADSAMYQAKEARQGPRRALQRRDPRPPAAPARARAAAARRARGRRARGPLPAAGRPRERPARRRRGARALERGLARRVHPARRGDRADRPARRVGAADRDARPRRLARAGPGAADGHGQRLHPPARGPGLPRGRRTALADAGLAPEQPLPGAHRVRADGRGHAPRSTACARSRSLGVYVGIDDFGTGHSSLARLRGLPVEVLKVDRSFVDGLGTEPRGLRRRRRDPLLAHALGLHVIAEGVETPLQADQLIALGCPVAQGFLWSPAVPAEQIPAHGRARHRRAPARSPATAASAAWSTR